ncbi:nicolin-1 isoform X4 [Dendrobates tinctorius]|uniref:nicolin-1 isoform X4 n=1 Tax=Dendrobates tinctorius TaxID=92724 RepID=UPI003CC9650D
MAQQAAPCSIRTPVPLQVGDGSSDPGVRVIDVTFPAATPQNMACAADNVTSLRLVLRQPSPVWLSFTLEELQINPPGRQSPQKPCSWWLSRLPPGEELQKLHKGLPDPERVSSEVQRMWVLTEVMRSTQSTAAVGRFDVDGCYDINLLSYT